MQIVEKNHQDQGNPYLFVTALVKNDRNQEILFVARMVMPFALFLVSPVVEILVSLANLVEELCWVTMLAQEVLGAFGVMLALAGQKELGMLEI